MMPKAIADFLVPIRKHFTFLFDQGYQVIYTEDAHTFDNVLVILGSKDAKIHIDRDRGSISLSVAPAWSGNNWSDPNLVSLDVILGFLENYDDPKSYEGDWRNQDAQVQRLANLFKPHMEQIISLLQTDTFLDVQKKLKSQHKKMIEARFKKKGI